jgi:ABC-type glycerol-3-phosphate transport system substrate-binding protein
MKMRPFELGLVVGFGILMVLALFLLRGVEPGADPDATPPFGLVKIWGTLPASVINPVIAREAEIDENYFGVSYTYISPENLAFDLIRAIADGQTPDMLLISNEEFVGVAGRLQSIPFSAKPLAEYRAQFIDGAEIFAHQSGYYGYPLAVDPLVLFWNRDIFASNNLLAAPVTWEEMIGDTIPNIVRQDAAQNILLPAVALGEHSNIAHYVPILTTLLLQSGSRLVVRQPDGRYEVQLNFIPNSQTKPLTQVATFYSNFSSNTNSLYTWNKLLPLDRELFTSNDLGMYFGYGSEASLIAERNPNLNFGVSSVPQGAGATVKRTYGKFYGIFITSNAPNMTGAFTVLSKLASQSVAKEIADRSFMAPAHRSSLAAGTASEYTAAVYDAALYTRGWYNPNSAQTNAIFAQMIDEVNGNRSRVTSAVNDALGRFENAYNR